MNLNIKFTYKRFNFFSLRFGIYFGSVIFVSCLILATFLMGSNIIAIKWADYKKNQNSKDFLENKKETLLNVSSIYFDKSSMIAMAVPDSKPILFVISQLKSFFLENRDVIANSFLIESEEKYIDDIYVLRFKIEVESSSIQKIFSLINYMHKIVPIVKVQRVDSDVSNLTVKSKIFMSVYWSSYPDRINKIDEQILNIDQKDLDIFDLIASFKQPTFSVLSPSTNLNRNNVFE